VAEFYSNIAKTATAKKSGLERFTTALRPASNSMTMPLKPLRYRLSIGDGTAIEHTDGACVPVEEHEARL
jgi:hypothetical protein